MSPIRATSLHRVNNNQQPLQTTATGVGVSHISHSQISQNNERNNQTSQILTPSHSALTMSTLSPKRGEVSVRGGFFFRGFLRICLRFDV
jgi:hypothetical protein